MRSSSALPPSSQPPVQAEIAPLSMPAFRRLGERHLARHFHAVRLSRAQRPDLTAARERGEIAAVPIHSFARMLAAALKEAALMIATAEKPAEARAAAKDSAHQLLSGLLADSG